MFFVMRICCLAIALSLVYAVVAEEDVRVPLVIHMDDAMALIGFAGEDAPRYREPMLLGRPAYQGTMVGFNQKEFFAGAEAQSKRGLLKLSHLIQKNRVQNWDDLQAFLHEIICNRYKINLQAHPILLILPVDEPFQNIQRYKDMMASIRQQQMQEMLQRQGQPVAKSTVKNTEGIVCVTDAVMALYDTGRVTGLVVLMNAGAITVVSVYESQPMPHTMFWKDISIADVNTYLADQLFKNRGYYFKTVAEMEIVKDIRDKLSYLALDYELELKRAKESSDIEKNYELPNGQVISIGKERFVAAECLFQPKMIGKDPTGLHEIVFNSIMKSDVDIRRDLYENVVVVGPHSMYPGMRERLMKDLNRVLFFNAKSKVIAPTERKYAVWIGGSLSARLKAGPLRKQLYPQEK